MATLSEINSFAGVGQYLTDRPDLAQLFLALLQKMAKESATQFMAAESQEGFVRLLYTLDVKMEMSAELLRFIGIQVFPYRKDLTHLANRLDILVPKASEVPKTPDIPRGEDEIMSSPYEDGDGLPPVEAPVVPQPKAIPAAKLVSAVEEFCTTHTTEAPPAEEANGVPEVPEEIAYLEDTWELHVAEFEMDEEIVSSAPKAKVVVAAIPAVSQKSAATTTSGSVAAAAKEESAEEVWEEETRPPLWQRIGGVAKRHQYFVPEIKKGSLIALEKSILFTLWAWQKSKAAYRHLKDQAIIVRQKIAKAQFESQHKQPTAAATPAAAVPGEEAAATAPGQKLPVPQKIMAYLQDRQYFLPQLKSGTLWALTHGKHGCIFLAHKSQDGYAWLKAREFFMPQAKRGGQWLGQAVVQRVRWLRDKQELYIGLTHYQDKPGYSAIFAKKPIKLALTSQQAQLVQKVADFPPKEALRVLQGLLKSDSMAKEDREVITQLKDMLVIHEKLLTENAAINDVINYGMAKFKSVLKRVSHITNIPKLNQQFEAYFLTVVEELLLEVPKNFRKEIDNCYTYGDLKKVMSHYPLYRLSLIHRYKSLKIVWLVQRILVEFEKYPGHLNQLLNKYLGPYGEVNLRNQLNKLLLTNYVNDEIWQTVSRERYLNGALRVFLKLQKRRTVQYAAKSLYDLVIAFMAEPKFSFQDFKISLNFVPEKLQAKVAGLVRQELQEKFNLEMNGIMSQQGKYAQRMENLYKLLKDPRYEGSGIQWCGSNPGELGKQLASIEYKEAGMEELLRRELKNPKLPDTFLQLITKAKKAEAAGKEKTVGNCLKMLQKIQESVARREEVQIHKALVALFKIHGEVNFATNGEPIRGYQVADEINRFYYMPNRTTLQLSEKIHVEVQAAIKNLVETERERQLVALKK